VQELTEDVEGSTEFVDNLKNAVRQQEETAPLLQSLMEGKELEKWQQHFCNIANVFMCCVDSMGNPLTEFEGNREEIDRIKALINKEQFWEMLLRVSESRLEDQAIETTDYPNLRFAVISSKADQKPVVNWLMCGVIEDFQDEEEYEKAPLEGFHSQISEKQFAKVADTLRDASNELIRYKQDIISAQAQSRRSRCSQKEMEESLHRREILTEIMQLLESEEAAEKVIQKLFETVGAFLKLSFAGVYCQPADEKKLELTAGWKEKNTDWESFKSLEGESCEFFKTEKTLVLSYDAMRSKQERAQMDKLGLKAVVVIPVEIRKSVKGYACFFKTYNAGAWQIEEIRFINDSVKILQSILTRHAQNSSLADSFASLETILNNIGSAVYVSDSETGEKLFANKSMRHAFDRELREGCIDTFLRQGIEQESGISEIYHSARERWYDLYHTQVKWVDGKLAHLCVLYDVTEKKVYQKKSEQQTYIDLLTGLYNRMCCEKDLEKYVDEAERTKSKGALLYLDLDDFKHINEGLGHQYGDVLLKAISNSLQRVEGIENTCYRVGGDEFVIIVPPERFKKLKRIVASIKDIFKKPWFLKDSDYYCTMSMGVVEFPAADGAVHELIQRADIAMYEAKKRGKNTVADYSDEIETNSGKRLDMEKNMRDATARGYQEFEVYFQPIIDIQKQGRPCTGAEALIRWNSAELGFIPPSEFIPLAEYLGLINPIGNYVLNEACKICKCWNDNGYPDYKVNVNLSVVQLLQSDIVEIVERTVKETGINPHNLTLEVTESLAINDMERMKAILENIKSLGVRIALDDFGTGYSSLNHIREIPFDVIKVDQSFIKDLDRDAYAKSFIKMVGDLAKAINVNLCVEGVETQKQYKILSEMSVSMVQGYYFDRPMKREAFEKKYTPHISAL